MKIIALKNEISADTAADILRKREPSINIKLVEPLYYPYFWLIASVKTKILSRSFDGNISCLVDLVNGVEAITGEVCEREEISVVDNRVLPIAVDNGKARKHALQYIRHTIIQKMKILSIPKIVPIREDFFYKPFWIIHCTGNDHNNFYLMMDSIGGQYQLLEP